MSMLIEQTQREMQDSFAFSRRAEIEGIKVSSASFSSKNLSSDSEESLSVGMRFVPENATISNQCVYASTLFECIVTESLDAELSDAVAKFSCSLLATYHLHKGYVPTESELTAFHKANVIYNCWPYFREFVQASAGRMNMPPPPVPFLRVRVVPDEPVSEILPGPRKKKLSAAKKVVPNLGKGRIAKDGSKL
jgi:hypothetical protein